jgi:hypothetical protein
LHLHLVSALHLHVRGRIYANVESNIFLALRHALAWEMILENPQTTHADLSDDIDV